MYVCVCVSRLLQQRRKVEPRFNGTSHHSYSSHRHQEDINLYQKLFRKYFMAFLRNTFVLLCISRQSFNNCPRCRLLSIISLLIMVVLCMKPSHIDDLFMFRFNISAGPKLSAVKVMHKRDFFSEEGTESDRSHSYSFSY